MSTKCFPSFFLFAYVSDLPTLSLPYFHFLYQLNAKIYVSKRRSNHAKSRKNRVCLFWRVGRLDRFLDSVCLFYIHENCETDN